MSKYNNNNKGNKRNYNLIIAKERGARLKEEIRRLGLTQGEVAKSLDMSLSGLTYLLSGRSQINPPMAYALELKFNIGSEWILEGRGFRRPQIYLKLDPWERMILELFNRHLDEEFLERILAGIEWSERANDVLEYSELAYVERKISTDEHHEMTLKMRKRLDELHQERRTFFRQLNAGLPWDETEDIDGGKRMTQRMREIWKRLQPDKHVDPESGGGSIPLTDCIRPLIMFLHYGQEEWDRIKKNWIGYPGVIQHRNLFYNVAMEALKEVQAEIKNLITATSEQLDFIEKARSRHNRVGAKYSADKQEHITNILKGDNDGTDG